MDPLTPAEIGQAQDALLSLRGIASLSKALDYIVNVEQTCTALADRLAGDQGRLEETLAAQAAAEEALASAAAAAGATPQELRDLKQQIEDAKTNLATTTEDLQAKIDELADVQSKLNAVHAEIARLAGV